MSGVSSPTGATACSWRGSGRRGLGWWLRSHGRAGQARHAGRDGWALTGLAGAAFGRAHFLHEGLSSLPDRGGLPSPVQRRHQVWGEQSPCAALGLLLDLPCADLRRKRPLPLLFRIPLARVLFECLPRRVRVEILRSAKAQGVSAWRDSMRRCVWSSPGSDAGGAGPRRGVGVRPHLRRQIHFHLVALRHLGRTVLPTRR